MNISLTEHKSGQMPQAAKQLPTIHVNIFLMSFKL